MASDKTLKLHLQNVYGEPLQTTVDLFFRNLTLAEKPTLHNLDTRKEIVITDLSRFPNGNYRLEIDARSYQTVSQFINIGPSGAAEVQFVLPVDPARVTSVVFPAYKQLIAGARSVLESSSGVLGFLKKSGEDLYNAMDDIRRAGFLNLVTKANNTRLENGKTVLSYIGPLTEVRGDRFFANIPLELISETQHSVPGEIFHPVDETLHEPPPGFAQAGSYKTFDHYGNLQLSFFSGPNQRYALDMDIDDAQGLEHIFQVVGNFATGQPTHPYNIHEILVEFQKLDPGYRLNVREDSAKITLAPLKKASRKK